MFLLFSIVFSTFMLYLTKPVLLALNGSISVCMTLLNKSIALTFPFPFFVLLIQNFFAAICSSFLILSFPSTCRNFQLKHLPLSIASTSIFILAIWLAMFALEVVSVPTYSVASNMRPLCTSLMESVFHRKRPRNRSLFGLGLIALGSSITAGDLSGTAWSGFLICMAYTTSVSLLAVLDNWMYRKFQHEQTALGINFYRLIISLPILHSLTVYYEKGIDFNSIENFTWNLIVFSGCLCLFSGLVFFSLTGIASSTSIQVANVWSKVCATMISFAVYGEYLNSSGWIGYSLSTFGCLIYFGSQ